MFGFILRLIESLKKMTFDLPQAKAPKWSLIHMTIFTLINRINFGMNMKNKLIFLPNKLNRKSCVRIYEDFPIV